MRRGDISGGRNLGKSRDRHGWSAIAAGRGEGLAVRLLAFLLSAVALSGAGMLLVGCQNEGEAIEASTGMTVGDNDVQLAGVAASAGAAAEAEKPVLSPEEVEADAVRVLGIKKGEPLETGFMFVDGRYIDAPYVVSRKGRQLLVNDVVVWQAPYQWPLPDLRVDEDPGPPTEVYAKAKSVDDLYGQTDWWDSHISRKKRYLWQHFPDEVARQKMIDYVRQLPFADSVEPSPVLPELLYVKSNGKDVGHISVGQPYKEALSFTENDVVEVLERNRLELVECLQEGRGVFIFPSLQWHAASSLFPDDVPALSDALPVLRSDKPEAEKLEILRQQGFIPRDCRGGKVTLMDEEALALVRQFAASEQLEERLRKLAAAAARAGDRR